MLIVMDGFYMKLNKLNKAYIPNGWKNFINYNKDRGAIATEATKKCKVDIFGKIMLIIKLFKIWI